MNNNTLSAKLFYLLLIIGVELNATGLLSDIMEPDGALYASIAKHITLKNDWINLIGDGHDWLDKPHFPFWMAALSFKLFGINSFAYKLPAFLFWLAGVYYTFQLSRIIYNTNVARVATLVYITAAHAVICNFDVRAEPYLTTLTLAGIYYFYKALGEKWFLNITAGAFFTACAVMTKGLFILITIGSGFFCYWFFTRQWKQLLHIKWLIAIAFIFIFILPELYCLYVQFDLHPEKIVFGKTNVSGLKFFFWDSQFGRFFNTGPIKGSGDPFFFLHTILWAFLPWSILLYVGIVYLIKHRKDARAKAWIIYGSALISFLLFSFSSFQLPHYIVIVFPQFAMIVAAYLLSLKLPQSLRKMNLLLTVLLGILAVLLVGLSFIYQLPFPWMISTLILLATIACIFLIKQRSVKDILIKAIVFASLLHLFLNLLFYPSILKYQSGMQAARWLASTHNTGRLAMYKDFSYSLEFYAPQTVSWLHDEEELGQYLKEHKPGMLYVSERQIDAIRQMRYRITIAQSFDYFPVSRLDGSFINADTRKNTLTKMLLINLEDR